MTTMPRPVFHRILVPVDFSDHSAGALRWAKELARCGDARLTVIYADAFAPPPYFTSSQIEQMEQQRRASRETAEAQLRRFAGPGVEALVVEGAPADAILRVAAERRADLVAMGTHGRSGWQRWTLGSVTEKVLRAIRVPLLTVGAAAEPPVRSILCPVNDAPVARRALAVASELARCFGAALHVLHVRETHAAERAAIEDLCTWIPAEQRSGCDVREWVREGDAAREIVSLASELACNLLVMGAQHRRFFDSTVLGATTVRVVRYVRCPILTVPEVA
jgi:nucleotide-binding universal stress UspA family protein